MIFSLSGTTSMLLPGWAGESALFSLSVLSLLLPSNLPPLCVLVCSALAVAVAILAARATNLASSCPATNWTGTCRLARRSHRGSASPGEPSLRTAARPSAAAASPRPATRSENLRNHFVLLQGCNDQLPRDQLPGNTARGCVQGGHNNPGRQWRCKSESSMWIHLACERRLCHMGCRYQACTKAGSPCARRASARPSSFSRRACLCCAPTRPAVPETSVRLAAS